jgi:palmitoyltransferase
MANFLIKQGANPNNVDNQGFNALHLAVHSRNFAAVLFMLTQNVTIDTTDPSGRTALIWASYQGSLDIANILIAHGASLEFQDSNGFTALHWTVVSGHFELAEKLINAGAVLDVKDKEGKTVTDWAKERNVILDLEDAIASNTEYMYNRYFNKNTTELLIWAFPTVLILSCIYVLSQTSLLYGALTAFAIVMLSTEIWLGRILLGGKKYLMKKTPFMAGLILAAFSFAVVSWIIVLPSTLPICF